MHYWKVQHEYLKEIGLVTLNIRSLFLLAYDFLFIFIIKMSVRFYLSSKPNQFFGFVKIKYVMKLWCFY